MLIMNTATGLSETPCEAVGEGERVAEGYPGKPQAIDQDMSEHFSVAEGLEATEERWMSPIVSRCQCMYRWQPSDPP
ncbi:unnamed protein product [Heligmosomoides polygyrus]|uniref:AMP-binding domain-containing protein n=1 Tax=Heligmosomoides polygyrus TaxID=6339 RepID=A0A183F1W3_HELPZ|nr:unnamed protein product [Heligmosomoides polygyrus]